MREIDIRLSADRISGRAGEKVRIKATFDKLAYASVNERRDVAGYQNVMRTTGKVQGIDIEATVHEDTTDFIVMTDSSGVPHLNENQNAVAAWYHVAVIGGGGDEPEPTPKPEPEKADLGKYQYSVGLLSDLHISKSSNDWWDEDDFKRCMDMFVKDQNVKCVMGCGDIAESATNAYQKHPESTCDADYKELKEMYDVPYWQVAGLRLFQPLGNHDFYGLFESRAGDTITGKKNSECISGYNANVAQRIADLWPSDGGINGIVPGRGRIVFDLEAGKHTPQGQADMSFFAFNGYVDLYAKQAGYAGDSIWDSAKGGISDAAIRLTKDYVTDHWDECKDRLTGWYAAGLHGRNGYSKLNYWLKKDNTIFIFLSVDYGDDVWPINDQWHDRMIHARKVIDTKANDPYVRRLVEYVEGTGYGEADRAYNYQYYSPNALIWLKEIVEWNPDCKVLLFTHHFLPNRVGNGVGLPKEGNWQYADIHPSNEKNSKDGGLYPVGSNALTGIEFWFFDRLLNEHRNVCMFSGHSHISWSSGANIDCHSYPSVSASARNKYVYTKASLVPDGVSGWTVSLPSMSKPRQIVDGQSVRRYQDAEMAVMDIHERGVRVKGYRVRRDNADVSELLAERDIQLI